MKIRRFDRVLFVLSAMMITYLYGQASARFGLFPDSFVDRAVRQTAAYMDDPHYVADRVYDRSGARTWDGERVQPGLTLVSTHREAWGWDAGVMLIDEGGDVLHSWRADPTALFPNTSQVRGVPTAFRRGVHGMHLFENGDVLFNIEYLGIARVDACGNTVWSIENGAHHSIARVDDGTFWIPVTSEAGTPASARYPDGYPGLDRPVNHDRLLRIDERGEVLDSISVLDVLYRNGLARYLLKARVVVTSDLMHVNDVEPLSARMADEYPLFDAGDLLVSLRASDLVLVVDPEAEVVKWHASDPFVQQHDPDFIGDGWIGVFNNNWDETDRGVTSGGSDIVAIQPHTDSVTTIFPTPQSDPFYTPFLGKWQQLANGNMLLTEGRAGRVMEVAPDGHTVWEWISEPYDAENAVEVTEGSRYDLTPGDVAQWRCANPASSHAIDSEADDGE